MLSSNGIKSDIAAAILLEKVIRDSYDKKAASEIQPLQWSILRYLEGAPEPRRTMTWIRSYLGLTHAPVVRAINTLKKRDLVIQTEYPDDARSKLLSLTESGLETLKSDPILGVAQHLHSLPEEERQMFRNLIRTLAMNTGNSDTKKYGDDPSDR